MKNFVAPSNNEIKPFPGTNFDGYYDYERHPKPVVIGFSYSFVFSGAILVQWLWLVNFHLLSMVALPWYMGLNQCWKHPVICPN